MTSKEEELNGINIKDLFLIIPTALFTVLIFSLLFYDPGFPGDDLDNYKYCGNEEIEYTYTEYIGGSYSTCCEKVYVFDNSTGYKTIQQQCHLINETIKEG